MSLGAKVVLLDLNEVAGKQAVSELGGHNNAYFIKTNVTNEAEVAHAYKLAPTVFKERRVRLFIHCAGIYHEEMIVTSKRDHSTRNF